VDLESSRQSTQEYHSDSEQVDVLFLVEMCEPDGCEATDSDLKPSYVSNEAYH